MAAFSPPPGASHDGDAAESTELRTLEDIDAEIAKVKLDMKRLEDAAEARRTILEDPVQRSRRRHQHRQAMGAWLETRPFSVKLLGQIAAVLPEVQRWTLTDADALIANGWRLQDSGDWTLDLDAAPPLDLESD